MPPTSQPAYDGRPHLELDGQLLAGREGANRPQPAVANAHRHVGAARVAYVDPLERTRESRQVDARERVRVV